MPTVYLPTREAELLAFAQNFENHITADPVSFGLTLAQATSFTTLYTAFANAMSLANDPATRTPSVIQTKRNAKQALVDGPGGIRQLVNIIQAFPGTTDTMRVDLKITVPDVEPTPVPPPATAPVLHIVSVSGRSVRLTLKEEGNPKGRGMPEGVDGATILGCVGEDAPENLMQWSLMQNTTRTSDVVDFPSTVPAGSKVWLTAFWFNQRKESGPVAAFQCTNISGGMAAAA